jgi:hypothetical protein
MRRGSTQPTDWSRVNAYTVAKRALKEVLSVVARPATERIGEVRDAHLGESCYIFGDGVSLKWFDLSAFPAKPAFVLSYLFFHKQVAALGKPVYGLLTEPYYFYPYFRLPWPPRTLWRNRIQSEYRRVVAQHPEVKFFVNLSNYPVLRRRNVYHLFRWLPASRFSDQCRERGQDVFHGSLRAAITLAIHMGFTDIFLVGCDYTHRVSRSLHWYEKGEGILTEHPGYNAEFFALAQDHAKLTTVTLEPGSDVLPHVSYQDLTGAKPAFRENTELAERCHLELLSTWPGYTVF